MKNETEAIKNEILERARSLKDGAGIKVKKLDGAKLIVTYSLKRARQDKYNREKGLKKLRQQIRSGKLTKQPINNRGYNKFLTISGQSGNYEIIYSILFFVARLK